MSGYRDEKQALAHENDALRRENEELRERLAAAHAPAAPASARPQPSLAFIFGISGGLIAFSVALGLAMAAYFERAAPPRVARAHAQTVPTPEEGALRIVLRADGTVLIGGESVAAETLEGRLRILATARDSTRVVIDADRGVAYARVVALMDQVRVAGFTRVALAVAPNEQAPAVP